MLSASARVSNSLSAPARSSRLPELFDWPYDTVASVRSASRARHAPNWSRSGIVRLAIRHSPHRKSPPADISAEQVSSVAARAKLITVLEFVREGDVLVVTKPDRLARSTRNLLDIVEDLEKRGIALVVLSMGGQRIDTRSPTGRLMLTMLGAIAAFERDLMLERQREGIARAAAEGKYKGRAPTARAGA
jgi:hypothetical protein